MASTNEITNYYLYTPSHVLPAVFAALVGVSLVFHTWQNIRYKFWRVTFFMFYGGAVFTAGWVTRAIATYHVGNLSLYIAQTILVIAAPPIYSAAEYNILGRLMHYLPMHASLNPYRVVYFFIYLGAIVEALSGAGAGHIAGARGDLAKLRSGSVLVFAAVVLQAAIECVFMSFVGLMHYRCSRADMLTPNVRKICITLYGTSTLVLIRCIFRAVEQYNIVNVFTSGKPCDGMCEDLLFQEWYIYAFDAAPMLLYTVWLNIMHPGKFLPTKRDRYLDYNKEERIGPGWTDKRSTLKTFIDPLDIEGLINKNPSHETYWRQPDNWPVAADGSFAQGTATNVVTRRNKQMS